MGVGGRWGRVVAAMLPPYCRGDAHHFGGICNCYCSRYSSSCLTIVCPHSAPPSLSQCGGGDAGSARVPRGRRGGEHGKGINHGGAHGQGKLREVMGLSAGDVVSVGVWEGGGRGGGYLHDPEAPGCLFI